MRARIAAATAAVLAASSLAACTTSADPTTTTTGTRTVTSTRTVAPPTSAGAVATVHPLAPGAKPRTGETEQACPYVRTGLEIDPTSGPNMADLEGDRIYRVTRLSAYRPVGCRFYFYAPPYEAVADIRPFTFVSATAARNAMIRTASAGTDVDTHRDFDGRGHDGIGFRTRYFGPDGARDWAFAFAKGTRMVVVYTQRADLSLPSVNIAQAIAPKF